MKALNYLQKAAALLAATLCIAACAATATAGAQAGSTSTSAAPTATIAPLATASTSPDTPLATAMQPQAIPTVGSVHSTTISLTSGAKSGSIDPSQTWLAPAGTQSIAVVVNLPQPLDTQQAQVQFVEPSTMLWKLSREAGSSPNQLAFDLNGSGVGLFSIQVAPGPGQETFGFSVQVGSDVPPSATSTPTNHSSVTMDDNDANITLRVGQSLLLKLGSERNWDVAVDNPFVLDRKKNVTAAVGGQGVYEALQPGRTILTAVARPRLVFQIDVTVVP